uniref:NADH-ubiquinone oxidoreductase chain 5 n=1 Tax=Lithobius maqinensis TaxID=2250572 RepID=Q9G401_9MYRI|nr:NADH dehydrogenase subunit 5 [Lithobius forficatus]AAG39992.1 NADH dehydrogenase subunit 5 [Lithobius forficatus]
MAYNLCKVSSYWLMLISVVSFPVGIWMGSVDYSLYLEWWVTSLSSCNIVMAVVVDWVALIFFSFVFFISSNVMYYSVDYMHSDSEVIRFAWLVLLFVISMMLLIFSPNFISILLGWDGLGLVSYCLVIYYQNVRSFSAGMITVLSNRIGDVFILLGISLMVSWGGWNILSFGLTGPIFCWSWVVFFSLIAAMTSSAQIPFSAWLPAAMAAPTPVSALVHSSTLVTAGVYLMIRFNTMLLSSTFFSNVLLVLSTLTMFMAGICANFETDLKKVVALSTLSQLGLMMMSLSMGYVMLAYFHLLTHALFKALLFMCAGAVIHASGESQDIRLMGGLTFYMPVVCVSMNIANLALCGFPFLAGFYSKDIMVEVSLGGVENLMIVVLLMLSVGLTAFYSFRLSFYSMWGSSRMSFGGVMDGGGYMNKGIILLGSFAIFGGSYLSWLLLPVCSVSVVGMMDKMMILIMVGLGIYLGMMINWNDYGIIRYFGTMFGGMWFLPYISGQVSGLFFVKLGKLSFKVNDYGWGECVGGEGAYSTLTIFSSMNQQVQTNSLKIYLASFLLLVGFGFGVLVF